jgi:K+ transporter
VIGALSVVFGDIGSSPIYTVQTIFNPDDPHPVPMTTENIYVLAAPGARVPRGDRYTTVSW